MKKENLTTGAARKGLLDQLQRLRPSRCFIFLSLLGSLSVLLALFLSHGELISCYFWQDSRDTGMDFFHSIEYVRGNHPYDYFGTLYPPLANLAFAVLYHLIPSNQTTFWSWSYNSSIAIRGKAFDLRTFQAPMILYVFFLSSRVCCLFLPLFSLCFGPRRSGCG